jgi:aerobic carbon-monoxide dehydrogenase medium subunit
VAIAVPPIKRVDYLRPASVADAVALKAEAGDHGCYWAGGTDLVLEWKRSQRVISHCIDLTHLDGLRGIRVEEDCVRLGAMTSLATLERATGRHPLLDELADMARVMCTPQTRTLATIAGNLCNASPAADLAPPLISFDAEVHILNADGPRTMPLDRFFTGVKRTALEPLDLVTEIRFPLGRHRRGAFGRVARTVVDIALVLVATTLDVDGGRIGFARVALGSVAPTPVRDRKAEQLLVGLSLDEIDGGRVNRIADDVARRISPITDVRTTAAYRREVTRVHVRRTLERALRESIEGDRD